MTKLTEPRDAITEHQSGSTASNRTAHLARQLSSRCFCDPARLCSFCHNVFATLRPHGAVGVHRQATATTGSRSHRVIAEF